MANILYGVNGEGSGHSSRARVVLEHLEAIGHSVHVVSFDRGLRSLEADFDVTEIFGLRLAYLHNRVRFGRTVFKNLMAAPRAARSAHKLTRLSEDWGIRVVITDFEPISCHVGRRLHLPVLSIDNQHCLIHGEISYPKRYRRDAAAAKVVTRLMTPGAEAYLITSFFPLRLKNRRAFLFPPILRREVLEAHPRKGDFVLVYVTSPAAELAGLLRQVRERFVCYGFNREGENGNLVFRKPSREKFLEDLCGAKAVLANAGFSLISEALYLGKPYLAWPVKRQFEQVFNAYYVDKMGYGADGGDLDKEKIKLFLSRLDMYRTNLARFPRKDNSRLFAKLDDLIAKFCG